MIKGFIITLSIIAALFLVYCALPNLYARNLSKNVYHKLKSGNHQIALTFDDGPNVAYTNHVLDILKKYDVKATFFIVIKNANKNLSILHRMKEEGHEIGFHSYQHESAWELLPKKTLTEISRGEAALQAENVTFRYMRPPWGTFNLFTLYQAKKHGLKVVLWNIEAFDWRKSQTAKGIEQEVLSRVEDGSIIVLHDSGGAEGAPNRTIEALDGLIPALLDQGYQFVTLEEGL